MENNTINTPDYSEELFQPLSIDDNRHDSLNVRFLRALETYRYTGRKEDIVILSAAEVLRRDDEFKALILDNAQRTSFIARMNFDLDSMKEELKEKRKSYWIKTPSRKAKLRRMEQSIKQKEQLLNRTIQRKFSNEKVLYQKITNEVPALQDGVILRRDDLVRFAQKFDLQPSQGSFLDIELKAERTRSQNLPAYSQELPLGHSRHNLSEPYESNFERRNSIPTERGIPAYSVETPIGHVTLEGGLNHQTNVSQESSLDRTSVASSSPTYESIIGSSRNSLSEENISNTDRFSIVEAIHPEAVASGAQSRLVDNYGPSTSRSFSELRVSSQRDANTINKATDKTKTQSTPQLDRTM
ncbi:hypothetical protein [Enterococcus mundtii]|uniref:Uncharacterized protein n=1 Tax=Enterococcus mundtii TaxID=53346 RepID=A0A242KUP8_ENTMU|nr:hypothetical protein [Enterococcus mundtii]OTP24861.1 hypothetical protein A5802_003016 [Enterococcus mundtii]